ncbi:lysophospholipid acyltransferase family protein [Kitasatospora viridis]|uniref:Lyso-ornithine lipid acyltransferase n=1 Tax=Kitasatospora viridis TaxID=281105 RepID=A0A561T6M8_9ACTN|nr:lyso-ornithine lipid acyltransferase [Kitasatospora viridis]
MERPAATVGTARRVLRAAGCAGVLLAGIGVGPVVRALPRRVRERLVTAWARTLLATLGVRVRALGSSVAVPGGLLVANHISWLDIAVIAAVCPGRNLAKTEVGRWPVLGPLVARSGTLFIDRDRLRSLPGTVARIAADLRRGERVVVFPEGSTWCGRAGGRFRPALFQAAIDAGAPVQPVAVRYRSAGAPTTVPAFVGEDGLAFSLWRVLSLRGLVAEAVVLPPIPTDPPTGDDRLARRAPARRALARRTLARAAQAAVDRERDGARHCSVPARPPSVVPERRPARMI